MNQVRTTYIPGSSLLPLSFHLLCVEPLCKRPNIAVNRTYIQRHFVPLFVSRSPWTLGHLMPELAYCWRVGREVPMCDEEEWSVLLPHLTESLQEIKGARQTHGSSIGEVRAAGFGRSALDCYFELTGYRETNPDNLWRYRRADYGPPCQACGKLLRTSAASHCVECGSRA